MGNGSGGRADILNQRAQLEYIRNQNRQKPPKAPPKLKRKRNGGEPNHEPQVNLNEIDDALSRRVREREERETRWRKSKKKFLKEYAEEFEVQRQKGINLEEVSVFVTEALQRKIDEDKLPVQEVTSDSETPRGGSLRTVKRREERQRKFRKNELGILMGHIDRIITQAEPAEVNDEVTVVGLGKEIVEVKSAETREPTPLFQASEGDATDYSREVGNRGNIIPFRGGNGLTDAVGFGGNSVLLDEPVELEPDLSTLPQRVRVGLDTFKLEPDYIMAGDHLKTQPDREVPAHLVAPINGLAGPDANNVRLPQNFDEAALAIQESIKRWHKGPSKEH